MTLTIIRKEMQNAYDFPAAGCNYRYLLFVLAAGLPLQPFPNPLGFKLHNLSYRVLRSADLICEGWIQSCFPKNHQPPWVSSPLLCSVLLQGDYEWIHHLISEYFIIERMALWIVMTIRSFCISRYFVSSSRRCSTSTLLAKHWIPVFCGGID